jgi:hypothetical protein
MRYSQASRQESRLPASRDNSGSPNLMCGKCWHQNLEELQKANNRVPWLKRGHIKSLPSHGENRGSSPLGSANDFRYLARAGHSNEDRCLLFVYYRFEKFFYIDRPLRFRKMRGSAGAQGRSGTRTAKHERESRLESSGAAES